VALPYPIVALYPIGNLEAVNRFDFLDIEILGRIVQSLLESLGHLEGCHEGWVLQQLRRQNSTIAFEYDEFASPRLGTEHETPIDWTETLDGDAFCKINQFHLLLGDDLPHCVALVAGERDSRVFEVQIQAVDLE
jgi:hypothetical protein